MLVLVAPAAAAAPEYALEIGQSIYRIDNPFLFPAASADPLHRSDTARSTDLGAALRLPLPSDRSFLLLAGTASRFDYDALGLLDHTQGQWLARYQWETHLLRGRLQHRYDQRLYNYYGGQLAQREVPRNTEDLAEVALRITPALELPVTASRKTLRYEDATLAQRYDLDDRTLELRFSYMAGTKSTAAVGVRETQVDFLRRTPEQIAAIDSRYTDRELFADVAWRATEDTILLARVGTLQRRFEHLPARNTQLVSTQLGMDWHYSPKTTVLLRAWNQPQPNDEADTRLYGITRGAQARVVWDATAKIRIALAGSVERQKYQSIDDASGAGAIGHDRVVRWSVRADYAATPRLVFTAEGLRERYTPDAALSSGSLYERSMLRLGISYSFENMTGANRARRQLDDLRFERIR
ncbi:hypothetical protein [Xylophilus sp.]|uniref:hypothetical protein n=1 Tax=Xylophilus sp. TaxID=2653893 RepID=UPI002D7FB1B3|nr:hypothetical protein [Xylophilus sp.]